MSSYHLKLYIMSKTLQVASQKSCDPCFEQRYTNKIKLNSKILYPTKAKKN